MATRNKAAAQAERQAKKRERLMQSSRRARFFDYSMKQKLIFFLIFLGFSLFATFIYNSMFIMTHQIMSLQQTETNLLKIYIRALQTNPLIAIGILLFGFLMAKLIMRTAIARKSGRDPRGFKIVEDGTQGSSRLLDRKEKQKMFKLVPKETPGGGTIMGVDKETDQAILLPWDNPDPNYKSPNFNFALFGPPGTRKTSGFLLPNIYNYLMEGFSIVVTDPKGEMYKETLAAAQYMEYDIKILNLIPGQFRHSDGWDVMKIIRDESIDEVTEFTQGKEDSSYDICDLMATIIMQNTGDITGDSFWYDANVNLLKVCLLYVGKAKNFFTTVKPNSKGTARTIEAVYELITAEDMEERIQMAMNASPEDRKLLSASFNIWRNHREATSIKSGLGIRLSILQNPDLVRVLSEDEIDFQSLNDRPTIIYINCSDKDDTYKSILTLFASFMIRGVTNIADSHESQELDRRLMIIFEEAYSIGKIKSLAKNMATLRSRKIGMIFCYQNIGQIMDVYGERVGGVHQWETILAACAVQFCLSANEITGMEYFSKMSGEMTVKAESSARNVSALAPKALRWSATEREQYMERGRPVFLPSEIRQIRLWEVLIIPAMMNVTLENKYYYKDHPMYNVQILDGKDNIVTPLPSKHIPNWYKKDLLENRHMFSGSPNTLKNMLQNDWRTEFIEGFGASNQQVDVELPPVYKFLSRFFDIEVEEEEEEMKDDRQISTINTKQFFHEVVREDEIYPNEHPSEGNYLVENSGPNIPRVFTDVEKPNVSPEYVEEHTSHLSQDDEHSDYTASLNDPNDQYAGGSGRNSGGWQPDSMSQEISNEEAYFSDMDIF